MTAASAHNEAGLNYIREHGDGRRSIQKLLRNCVISHIHYFGERVRSFLRVFGRLGDPLWISLLRGRNAGG